MLRPKRRQILETIMTQLVKMADRHDYLGISDMYAWVTHEYLCGAITAAERKALDELCFVVEAYTLPWT